MIPLSTPPGAKIIALITTHGEPLPNISEGQTYTLARWTIVGADREPCVYLAELDHSPRRIGWLWKRRIVIAVFSYGFFRLPVTLQSLTEIASTAPNDLDVRRVNAPAPAQVSGV